MRIHVDPNLVEEAIRIRVEADLDRSVARQFNAERVRCYDEPEDTREAAFRQCFRHWFARLGLEDVLRTAFSERRAIEDGVSMARVSLARRERDQGVEMFVGEADEDASASDARRLHVRIRPATLADAEAALAMLRPELLHVADMLDPGFGYRPHLPPSQAGPTHDRLLLDRYSVLWSASVWGRLVREGRARPCERERALARVVEKFPRLAADAEAIFSEFLDGERPTHERLVAFVLTPPSTTTDDVPDPGSRCALCGCPTYEFVPVRDAERVAQAIHEDFPSWTGAKPVCPQCADLYEARVKSASAAL